MLLYKKSLLLSEVFFDFLAILLYVFFVEQNVKKKS